MALLDILGFKRILKTQTRRHVESVYEDFLGDVRLGLSNGKFILGHEAARNYLCPDVRQATVNSLVVTDGILLWSSDASAESFSRVVKTVQRLLALSLVNGTPLRGALSFGPLPLGPNQQPPHTDDFQRSLIGVELINSEKRQEWSGCEVLEAAIASYMKTCPAEKSSLGNEVVLCTIPRKDGEQRGYAVDWFHSDCADIDFQTIQSAFAPPRDSDATNWEKFRRDEWPKVKNKMENTLRFLNFLCAGGKTAFMV